MRQITTEYVGVEVNSQAESTLLQTFLFEKGYKWGSGKEIYHPVNTYPYFLCIDNNKLVTFSAIPTNSIKTILTLEEFVAFNFKFVIAKEFKFSPLYSATIKGNTLKVGCSDFTKEEMIILYDFLKEQKFI